MLAALLLLTTAVNCSAGLQGGVRLQEGEQFIVSCNAGSAYQYCRYCSLHTNHGMR